VGPNGPQAGLGKVLKLRPVQTLLYRLDINCEDKTFLSGGGGQGFSICNHLYDLFTPFPNDMTLPYFRKIYDRIYPTFL
jgi:hypothetical protein